jgi:hypothetical protein
MFEQRRLRILSNLTPRIDCELPIYSEQRAPKKINWRRSEYELLELDTWWPITEQL